MAAVAAKSPINLVVGAGNIGDTSIDRMARFDTPEQVSGFLDTFTRRGYNQLDTSCMYSPAAPGSSEPRIGAVNAGDKFVIDTKVGSWSPKAHEKENILRQVDISLEELKIKQINTYYLHLPDRETPFEEPCEAMNEAYKAGKFKQWGICNYSAAEVQRFIDICEERGFVKPGVYQGQYNPLVRGGEKELFDVLRKNGIAFYAYSPAAAGFFAGNHKNVKDGGRYDTTLKVGEIYAALYLKPAIQEATEKALEVASKHDIGGHAAALRWTVHHSILGKEHGDSVILGASSPGQLESNIDMIEQGPLPDDVVDALGALYREVGDQIPYHL
ncbi:Oxidoreductase sirO [Colletotrichum trifolii]|uniref:Oxidoreductase sirO n=1 Tax=Colletotrichum trifolii TaxID=5466 RepID=A0A4R8RUG9_COLTR|nr:Oxidoreductase sirO [Colletotrichum trifolii]